MWLNLILITIFWVLGYTNKNTEKEVNKMKYVCEVCGYVYDEEAEGVKWEDLPEDYACPLCGVGKDQFSKED